MEGNIMFASSSTLRRGATLGLAVAASLALAACGSSSPSKSSNPLNASSAKGTVVIGSANFPENELLAQIYATALAAKGVKVTDKFNIGSREVYYPEIKKGAVSIIPEYNGTLLTVSVSPSSTASTTTEVNAALTAGLPPTMEILNSASAQDSDSVTVTQAFAKAHNLTSIADLKPIAGTMVFGGPPEFPTRSDGLKGLQKNYGVVFKSFDPLDESGPLTLAALTGGKVQVADVFTTTPQIITDHLVSLSDPKANFAAQNVIPLVYKADSNSTITSTLNTISAALTTSALLQMDNAVITDKQNYSTVATAFLQTIGIS